MKVVARPRGLMLDANAIVPADGSMRVAEHVVCDQQGIVRARPTNDLHVAKASTDYRPRALLHVNDELHAVSSDGTDWRYEDEGAVVDADASPPSQAQLPRLYTARGSVYYTTETGIRKHVPGEATAIQAGVEPFIGPLLGGSVGVAPALGTVMVGGPLPGTPLEGRVYFDPSVVFEGDVFEWYKTVGSTNYAVYLVVRREDANGYVRRSPPTRIYLGGAGLPTTDAFLWQTYTITAADVANGYLVAQRVISVAPDRADIYVSDEVNDDLLGEALYTNPGQQGALGARYAPPSAAEIASYDGCTWYGNTVSKHRAQVTITNVAGSTDVTAVDAENPLGFIGAITAAPLANVSTTAGSPNITGLSDDFERFLRVGQYITDASNITAGVAGTAFPADTLVVSWATGAAPGTIDLVVSNNATATGARDVYIGDVISIGGRNFYAWDQDGAWSPDSGLSADYGRRVFGIASTAISATGRNAYVAATLAAAVNYESLFDATFRIRATVLGEPYVYSSVVSAPADVLLEEIGVGGAGFSVSSSNPTAISPNLPIESSNDASQGRLWYSEPDEPEAVPLPNFLRVGDASKPILALSTVNDSLLVWKTDGLFAVTGSAPDGWRVETVDASVRLLSSGVVDVADGTAYAWTDCGVVRASIAGVQRVSQAIDEYLSVFAREVLDSDLVLSWVSCWRSERLVLLAPQAPDIGNDSGPAPIVVMALSTVTGAWSTFWQRTPEAIYCAHYAPAVTRLFWSRSNAWEVRAFDDRCMGSDRTYSTLTVSASDDELTISKASAGSWVPRAGDWISRGFSFFFSYFRIVEVVDDGSDWVVTIDGSTSDGETTWAGIEGVDARMQWQNTGPPALWQQVREQQIHVDGDAGNAGPTTIYLEQGGASSLADTTVVAGSPGRPSSLSRPYRYGVPRAVSRAAHYYPVVNINALGFGWRLHELAVVGEVGSEKVRR